VEESNKVMGSVAGAKAFELAGSNTVVQYCKVEGSVRAGPKAWRVKKLKASLTLDRDIGMNEVEALSARGLVGRFGYRAMAARDINVWVDENWGPVVGYIRRRFFC
jgi:hypothetical protein